MYNYKIKQYKYNANNNINSNKIEFPGKVTQLNIQTIPGVKFCLNKTDNLIEIGRTGIFEINYSDFEYIDSLQFYGQNSINIINQNYCYIDIVYISN